jgi:hypothetical protein
MQNFTREVWQLHSRTFYSPQVKRARTSFSRSWRGVPFTPFLQGKTNEFGLQIHPQRRISAGRIFTFSCNHITSIPIIPLLALKTF